MLGTEKLFNLAEKDVTRSSNWQLKPDEIKIGNKTHTFNSKGD